jgi:hypothetical protein
MHAMINACHDEQSLSFLCSCLMLTGEESLLFLPFASLLFAFLLVNCWFFGQDLTDVTIIPFNKIDAMQNL